MQGFGAGAGVFGYRAGAVTLAETLPDEPFCYVINQMKTTNTPYVGHDRVPIL